MTGFLKFVLSLLLCGIALTPTWVYLVFKYYLSPEGFWEKLITLGLGISFLGTIQLVLLIVFVAAICRLWTNEDQDEKKKLSKPRP